MFDIIVERGTIVDGTGAPGFTADVGIQADRILAIGDLSGIESGRRIDAGGRIVAPGFIDIHSHSDFSLLVNAKAESQIHQGVTTEVVGNCGHSCAPCTHKDRLKSAIFGYHPSVTIQWSSFDEYLTTLEKQKLGINVAAYVGHGTLRIAEFNGENRTSTPEEVAHMARFLEEALDSGAIGLSTGLEYAPGSSATTQEVITLCKVVSRYNRIYATHVRNRELHYEAGFSEAFMTARGANVRTQISHIVPKYGAPPGAMAKTLELIEQLNSEGDDVAFDVIPHEWGPTTMSSVLPPWAFDGSIRCTLDRLSEPHSREKLKHNDNPIWHLIPAARWDLIRLFHSAANADLTGLSIEAIAYKRGVPAIEAVFDLLLEEGESLFNLTWIAKNFAESDTLMALRQSSCGVISDSITLAPYGVYADTKWSPSTYGWAARLFGKYVRDLSVLSLEDGVFRVTGLAAKRLGLKERGLLQEGYKADIVIFDAGRIDDKSKIETPNVYPVGIRFVLVNGCIAIDNAVRTNGNAGVVLRAA